MMKMSLSPHIRGKRTTTGIMLDVLTALLPTAAAGVYIFGAGTLLTIAVSVAAAMASEALWQCIAKKPVRVGDLSAAVTGLLLALSLPPGAPWWLALIGSAFAIIIVKQLFGGIGDNFLNPALTARALLLASWPVAMTAYTLPTFFSGADAVSSATPLAGGEGVLMDMFLGNMPGCTGEVCKAAILLGFVYLLLRRVISWRIPVIYMGVFTLLMWAIGGFKPDASAIEALLGGSVMFGAVFMATDYTTSPMTKTGQAIYAAGCGILGALIRSFSSYPEGTTFAILLMNIATPLIDRYIKPRVYGTRRQRREAQ